MESLMIYPSPLGELTVAASDRGVTALTMAGQRSEQRYLPKAWRTEQTEILRRTKAWLDDYFAGRDPGPIPPVDLNGTAFQMRVWRELVKIPMGATVTYGQIARTLGTSPRAVGGAVGRNPVSILIPCHRVVGEKSLTGYDGGLKRKAWLLDWEKATEKTGLTS